MSHEATVLRHEPCPVCPSSDAYAVYSDGGGYCFSCRHYQRPDNNGHTLPSGQIDLPINRMRHSGALNYTGQFQAFRARGINEDTARKFNVRVDDSVTPVVQFPYYDSSRQIVGAKVRPADKKEFRWEGKNPDHQLFGQHLFGGGKRIVITEGEFDCLAVWQCIGKNWPVVSLPNGAAAAKKALQHQLDYLLSYEEIVLFYDNDSAGIQAVQDCIDLFPPERVFIATLDTIYKDACEALAAKDSDAVRQAIWNKKPFRPTALIDGRDLYDTVRRPLHGRDADYPYPDLNDVSGGLRQNELVTITAGSGSGKSTLCGEIAVALINQGQSVGYIALEESIQRTGLRLMTVAANKPLHLNNEIPEEEFKACFESTLGSGRVHLRHGFGSVDPDALLNDIRYLVKTAEVKWIILDHLSILLSGNETTDERKLIDVVMTKLRSFVEETGIGMILISHLRRNQGDKGHEDGAAVSLGQLRGSHSIAQLSDLVVALQRDIKSGDNCSELVVLKNRFNGQTGPAGQLSYERKTGRLLPVAFTSSTPTDFNDF